MAQINSLREWASDFVGEDSLSNSVMPFYVNLISGYRFMSIIQLKAKFPDKDKVFARVNVNICR